MLIHTYIHTNTNHTKSVTVTYIKAPRKFTKSTQWKLYLSKYIDS